METILIHLQHFPACAIWCQVEQRDASTLGLNATNGVLKTERFPSMFLDSPRKAWLFTKRPLPHSSDVFSKGFCSFHLHLIPL